MYDGDLEFSPNDGDNDGDNDIDTDTDIHLVILSVAFCIRDLQS